MSEATVIEAEGIKVTITRSAGQDDALVVFIDTPDLADGPDGPELRVLLNDEPIHVGVEFLCPDCGVSPDDPNHGDVHYDKVN